MIMMVIKCPKTQEDVPTGITVPSLAAYYSASFARMTVSCPHCGETHAWDKQDTFLVMATGRGFYSR